MDQIDLNLFDAWRRIGEACQRDRAEAFRRARRQHLDSMKRPPRAWCLCIRAADTRINLANALFDFRLDTEIENGLRYNESPERALARGVPHTLTLDAALIRDLTRPVAIRYPGVTIKEAAELIGRNYLTIYRWIDRSTSYPYSSTEGTPRALARRPGQESAQSIRRTGALKLWGYDYPAVHRKDGGRGMPMACVYTPSPIDPNHEAGLPPDPVWGSLWQGMNESLPDGFTQSIQRVPMYGSRKGIFRGWHWECPGLVKWHGEHLGCGRHVRALYAPLPVWTLAGSGLRLELEMPEDSGLAGTWRPGEHDVPVGKGRRAFACKACWRVCYPRMSDGTGWNVFVSYISGGLLQGHEVARPLDEAPLNRRHGEEAIGKRKAPRCEEVAQLYAQGLKPRQIAKQMGLTIPGVSSHLLRALKRHGVSSRAELREKLRREMAATPERREIAI